MREPPPQAVMGLLNYITATSLDEDYAHVSAQRSSAEKPPRRRGRWGLAVLAAFGVLLSTAAVETARNASDSANSHSALVGEVNAGKRQLAQERARVQDLRNENEALQTTYLQATAEGRSLQGRLDRLGVFSGALPVQGRGIKVTVDDAPGDGAGQHVLDKDLQKLVNGLWQVGAEAVAVNGQRVSNLTAIRQAGEGITVNFRHVNRPYVVSAIGDPDQMGARFLDTAAGQTWLALKSTVNLKFDISIPEEPMKLPAASRLTLRHAHAQVPEEAVR